MKIHELKCSHNFYMDIVNGRKTFEVRKNDREFAVGDMLLLRDWADYGNWPADTNHVQHRYTGSSCSARIIYILDHTQFHAGLKRGYVVMGLEDIFDNSLNKKI